ncbi:beta-glucosidase [Kineococcus sp. R8]|uniref:GH1 family beta-glucosidase n=1 Tax=Kineococcus siccus TaxID=2696567 RepID=UPI0014131768|nr:beta-glucosidase [Kineococcus siccus]
MTTRAAFPAGFAWGTATAAYQVEGAADEDGRGPSVWDVFARRPGAVADGSTGDVADDHYHRFAEDVRLMADLGVTAYRFSLSWSRVQPTGAGPANAKGLDFYRRLAEELRDHGITPYATLYHWDLPQPLEDAGGWLARDTAARFADYAVLATSGLGDLVDRWTTLNEPWCAAFLGYAAGVHAPGRREGARAAQAAHHLLLGHGLAVDAVRAAAPAARVGVVLNLYSVQAASSGPADADAARRIDGLQNRFFLDPVLRGTYPEDVLADLGQQDWFAAQPDGDLAQIHRPLDFLGVNYYSRHTVAAPAPAGVEDADVVGLAFPGSEAVRSIDTGAPRTHMGWPVCPEGLLDVLAQAHALAPQLPLLVTENGAAYPDVVGPDGAVEDPERTDYLVRHVEACAQAVRQGIPLTGYFLWSLLDNWEWAWGFSRRFGVVHVDYATQARTVKASGRWLRSFLRGEEAPAAGLR